MLHITIGESEERVLRESNQFPQDDFMSFCLILSYGNIKNIEKEEDKELPSNNESWKVNIKGKLEELDEKIKKNKDIRIWYSRLDNEDVCNMCFLVYYLSKYDDVNIYLSEVGRGWGGLGAYSSDEIINLIDKKELLKENNGAVDFGIISTILERFMQNIINLYTAISPETYSTILSKNDNPFKSKMGNYLEFNVKKE